MVTFEKALAAQKEIDAEFGKFDVETALTQDGADWIVRADIRKPLPKGISIPTTKNGVKVKVRRVSGTLIGY